MSTPIDHDLTCLNCGYNLRGTDPAGVCPECGIAVRTSRREDRLVEAPPTWRAGLRRGATWFGLGVLLTLPLLYVGLAMATWGAWRMTAAQPGRADPARDLRLRWACRLLLLGGTTILLTLMAGSITALALDRRDALALRWQVVDAAFIAGHALYWMGLLALATYLGGLAQRIPDARLLRRLHRFRQAWLIAMGVCVCIALAAAGADVLYRFFNLHYAWTTAAFALAILVLLLSLWIETLTFSWRLRQALGRVDGSTDHGDARTSSA